MLPDIALVIVLGLELELALVRVRVRVCAMVVLADRTLYADNYFPDNYLILADRTLNP